MTLPPPITPPLPSPIAPTFETLQQIERYEAAIARLRGALADYVRREPAYRWGFGGLMGVGLACFSFGGLVGVWGTLSAALVSGGGFAMYKVRLWELESEIQETRADIARLQRANPFRPAKADPTRADG